MSEFKLTVEQIKELMDKLKETGLGEVSVSDGEFVLRLRSKENAQTAVCQPQQIQYVQSEPAKAQQTEFFATTETSSQTLAETQKQETAPEISGTPVISPLVGTFFEAPSPEKPPFVTIGSKVKKGDVLFVVESMKLMNEIQSEIDGEIVAINVKNAQPVEYGQSIMVIK